MNVSADLIHFAEFELRSVLQQTAALEFASMPAMLHLERDDTAAVGSRPDNSTVATHRRALTSVEVGSTPKPGRPNFLGESFFLSFELFLALFLFLHRDAQQLWSEFFFCGQAKRAQGTSSSNGPMT